MFSAQALASVFGPFLFIVGLWMLLYSKNFIKVISGVKSTPAVFCLTGFINLILGLTIVNSYNQWVLDLSLAVTLLGWVWLLRGIAVLFVPQLVVKLTMSNEKAMNLMGFIPFIWGLILSWYGFGIR